MEVAKPGQSPIRRTASKSQRDSAAQRAAVLGWPFLPQGLGSSGRASRIYSALCCRGTPLDQRAREALAEDHHPACLDTTDHTNPAPVENKTAAELSRSRIGTQTILMLSKDFIPRLSKMMRYSHRLSRIRLWVTICTIQSQRQPRPAFNHCGRARFRASGPIIGHWFMGDSAPISAIPRITMEPLAAGIGVSNYISRRPICFLSRRLKVGNHRLAGIMFDGGGRRARGRHDL